MRLDDVSPRTWLFGAAAGWALAAWMLALAGMVTLAVAHALAKAGLFLCAGTLKKLRGTDELRALPGLAHAHPGLLLAMGLTAVSLVGLPISAGFTGKWQDTTGTPNELWDGIRC